MLLRRLLLNPLCGLFFAACAVYPSAPAHADTIAWTNWSTISAGNPGSASGTAGTITVTYSGQTNGLTNVPSWTPASTFTGGVVGNAPPHTPTIQLFNILGGGPSTEFGGSAITSTGSVVHGSEGNGLVQFMGSFDSITFTTPNFENYYAFTVGYDATLSGGGGTVPEPATLSLFGLGVAALPLLRRSLSRRSQLS
jgi:hypothetical protein